MTAIFVLLTIGLGRELKYVNPSSAYLLMTGIHYLTTEPIVVAEAANFPLFSNVKLFDSQVR